MSPRRSMDRLYKAGPGASQLVIAAPVTGSLVCFILFSRRDITWTVSFPRKWTAGGTDWVLQAGYQVLLQLIAEYCNMDVVGSSEIDNRAGKTFEVELYVPCKAAKIKYRQKHPAPCTFCGTIIKCDMYRHVARRHLELAQLWRCPVSWCTVWRGTPQDLMDHIRDAHNMPGEFRKVSLEMLFPPWTVTRQVYAESLTAQHSGISNDVLLFSEV